MSDVDRQLLGAGRRWRAGAVHVGRNFEFLDLNQPSGSDYLVARAVADHRYDLVPVQFSNGVTMWGSIVTDGRTGALDAAGIVDWDIVVEIGDRGCVHASRTVGSPRASRL